jgi:hypothetical protein
MDTSQMHCCAPLTAISRALALLISQLTCALSVIESNQKQTWTPLIVDLVGTMMLATAFAVADPVP